jgi:hypothetical protein
MRLFLQLRQIGIEASLPLSHSGIVNDLRFGEHVILYQRARRLLK